MATVVCKQTTDIIPAVATVIVSNSAFLHLALSRRSTPGTKPRYPTNTVSASGNRLWKRAMDLTTCQRGPRKREPTASTAEASELDYHSHTILKLRA